MTEPTQPVRRTRISISGHVYFVDLWYGLFRDEVRVWKDVRPALGGLLGTRRCWHGKGRGEALHDQVVDLVRELFVGAGFSIPGVRATG